MPFYQNSVIYKLCHINDLDNENIYIGSTTNFKNRKNQHKESCNNKNVKDYHYKVYQFIRDNGGWNEWQMIPIESFPCNNKIELQIRERYHIELLKSKLNKQIPTRTHKEYRDDNKEQIQEQRKIFYENNKEIISKKMKEYLDDNKEILAEKRKIFYNNNKKIIAEKRKIFYNNNKENKLEKAKIYYENNKKKILEELSKKIECEKCGSIVRKDGLKEHQKTKKCIDYI